MTDDKPPLGAPFEPSEEIDKAPQPQSAIVKLREQIERKSFSGPGVRITPPNRYLGLEPELVKRLEKSCEVAEL